MLYHDWIDWSGLEFWTFLIELLTLTVKLVFASFCWISYFFCHSAEELFKACVKDKGEDANNYDQLVFDYIKDHKKGKADFDNIGGLLFYYRDSTDEKTADDIYRLMLAVNPTCRIGLTELMK